jgi:tetratricopeptide (TPR) repeat protein
LGQHAGSREVLEKLLGRDPKCIDALKGVAAVALDQGDHEAALNFHKQLGAAGEETPEVLYNSGLLAQRLGRVPEAISFYEKALAKKPGYAQALLNLGHALAANGDAAGATRCWVEALDADPELARGYFHPGA